MKTTIKGLTFQAAEREGIEMHEPGYRSCYRKLLRNGGGWGHKTYMALRILDLFKLNYCQAPVREALADTQPEIGSGSAIQDF